VHNSVQVVASWQEKNEDIWKFNSYRDTGTNPILFKSSDRDSPEMSLIFELVVYVKLGTDVQEMSCGWAQLPFAALGRSFSHKLEIKGGSPTT